MLQLSGISKRYQTGELIQQALDNVSLNLRRSEFVSILGPSGSGKTTLLNIIGGLDRYDSGDLIINGVSTREYKDRDWDAYRNHTIGFVFQSYNLIPHQSILFTIPVNSIIRNLLGTAGLTAVLPWTAALLLVALSMAITVIAGLIPSRAAAKKDPVAALRTE